MSPGPRTHLRPTLKRIDVYVIRWARRKFKRLRHQTKGARDWFAFTSSCKSNSICSLAAMSWQRPNIGSRINRELHVRFWERAEVQFLRATRTKREVPLYDPMSASAGCGHAETPHAPWLSQWRETKGYERAKKPRHACISSNPKQIL